MISNIGWNSGFNANYMDNVSNCRADLKFFDLGFLGTGVYSNYLNGDGFDTAPGPPALGGGTWLHPDRAWYDTNERHFLFDRMTDVMTTRSDTFLVYIIVQEIDTRTGAWNAAVGQPQPTILQTRRMVAIIDRSKCCKYPGGGAAPDPNDPQYFPQVVARSVTTW
jgi:hypothetical protein